MATGRSPLDNSAADRFYSLRDPDVFEALTQAEYDNYPVARDGDLVEVAGQVGTVIPHYGRGWQLTLPGTEKVLSTARTFNDTVYFVTFEPRTNSADPCQAGLSLNRLYRVDVANGDPVVAFEANATPSPEEIDDARVSKLEQGGIAPQPVFLFPGPWDPDGCQGEECRRGRSPALAWSVSILTTRTGRSGRFGPRTASSSHARQYGDIDVPQYLPGDV